MQRKEGPVTVVSRSSSSGPSGDRVTDRWRLDVDSSSSSGPVIGWQIDKDSLTLKEWLNEQLHPPYKAATNEETRAQSECRTDDVIVMQHRAYKRKSCWLHLKSPEGKNIGVCIHIQGEYGRSIVRQRDARLLQSDVRDMDNMHFATDGEIRRQYRR